VTSLSMMVRRCSGKYSHLLENLGYFDDGEEHLGVVDDASEGCAPLSVHLIPFSKEEDDRIYL
jgi:hypothetical protein